MVVAALPARPPQLAFSRLGATTTTWIVNADGTGRRRWHAGRSPVWSHDGRRVVFASWGDVRNQWWLTVYVENTDGGGRHRIAHLNADRCFDARWSPDDSAVAFAAGCDIDSTSIWVAGKRGKPRSLIRGRVWAVAPRWSPDGRSVLVGTFAPNGLLRIDAANGAQRRIPNTQHSDVNWFWVWAKGDHVYFLNDAIYTAKLDGSGRRQLSPRSVRVLDFDLSPDGQTIAFTGGDGRRRNVYLMPARGGKATKLTNGVHDFQPTWSPDGRLIAFVRELPSRARHLFTMRADGSRQRDLSRGAHDDESPRWIR